MSESARRNTAAILTLGCKLNIADSEAMARRLRDAGWDVTDRATEADAVIVNTCSVTHVADQKSRHLVRMARRVAPSATVALTGCLVETAGPDKIEALGADLVYRQPDQIALADRIVEVTRVKDAEDPDDGRREHELLGTLEYPSPGLMGASRPPEAHASPDRREGNDLRARSAGQGGAYKTRAFISAQEGCNDVCAFCIIPRTRGRERSKSVGWVVEEAQKREAEGVREIVITGTQLGHYGSDIGVRLYDVMKALLAETSIPRIRMSSVQPQDLDDDLIGLWGNPRLCRHYHLALQSGSEAVLQRMRRRYTKDQYRRAVHRLRDAIADIAITTDVIAGFPGETDFEFEEGFDFCREMAFAGIHVFPYSQRSGTVAYRLPDQIAEPVKKHRVHRLIALASEMSQAYRQRYAGGTASVLWESRRDGDAWEGLTDTYVRVRAASRSDMTNRITAVRITAVTDNGLLGEVTA
jgi:threonylcarbamoyladenosine tRNA methylthiotransferase MtaB